MKCPVCSNNMQEEKFGEVRVDVCKDGCKGIWFDCLELRELDERWEGSGGNLGDALDVPRVSDTNRGRIICPKCVKSMQKHKYKASNITVDECYICGGFFLDAGEFKAIRDMSMTKQERTKEVNKLVIKSKHILNELEEGQRKGGAFEQILEHIKTRFLLGFML